MKGRSSTLLDAFHRPRLLLAAMVTDSVGTGLFLPFGVAFFLGTTDLSLGTVGFALSLAALVALPTPFVVGPLVDRFGAGLLVAAGNLVSAAAFTCYLWVEDAWQLVAAACLASIGQAGFWTSTRALVGEITSPEERTTWFSVQTATRNAGYGLGGLLGAVAIGAGNQAGYLALAGANALSYIVAALLVLRWQIGARRVTNAPDHGPSAPPSPPGPAADSTVGYRMLVRDRSLLVVSGINLIFVICSSVLTVLMAVYLSRQLGAATWIAGVLFSVNTVLVVVAQTYVSRRTEGRNRKRVLRTAAACFAVSFLTLWAAASAPTVALGPVLLAAVLVFTLAEMLEGPLINSQVVDMAPAAGGGRYLAIYQMSWSLGAIGSPALLTWLLSLGTAAPWLVLTAGCALAATLTRQLP